MELGKIIYFRKKKIHIPNLLFIMPVKIIRILVEETDFLFFFLFLFCKNNDWGEEMCTTEDVRVLEPKNLKI